MQNTLAELQCQKLYELKKRKDRTEMLREEWHCDASLNKRNNTKSTGLLPLRKTLGPLFLLVVAPVFAISMLIVIRHYDGNLRSAIRACINEGALSCFIEKVPSLMNFTAWKIIGFFIFTAMLLTRCIPCKMFVAPPTPTGYRNKYYANGVQYWLCMNFFFLLGSKQFGFGFYSLGVLYDCYNDIVLCLCAVAFALCIFLYIKGLYFPSSQDCGSLGNIIFDFYYGTELHPNVLGWDVKQVTNDRFGMTWWGIACISFAAKQYETFGYVSNAMIVSVALQWIYLTKFFVWESGYFCSMDIQHDRAGFYICWGCLVWVPSVYTSTVYWLTMHPINISILLTCLLICFGILMIFVNYDADRQRQKFRQSGGNTKIWGKSACKIIAEYRDQHGEVKQALLLASGWWGLARHFHYVPEIAAAFCWAAPVHLDSILPYFYVIYLIILLCDRAFRDDARCYMKYGEYWNEYCRIVPHKIIPYVF